MGMHALAQRAAPSGRSLSQLDVLLVVMAAVVALVVRPAWVLVDACRQAPIRAVARAASASQKSDEPILAVGPRMPSLVFYAQRPVAFFETWEEARGAMREVRRRVGLRSFLVVSGDGRPRGAVQASEGDWFLSRVRL